MSDGEEKHRRHRTKTFKVNTHPEKWDLTVKKLMDSAVPPLFPDSMTSWGVHEKDQMVGSYGIEASLSLVRMSFFFSQRKKKEEISVRGRKEILCQRKDTLAGDRRMKNPWGDSSYGQLVAHVSIALMQNK